MPTRKRAKSKRLSSLEMNQEARKVAATRMYLQGFSMWEISRELEMSDSGVKYLLELVKADWQQEYRHDFVLAKNRELDRVDTLERAYWQAWLRSGGAFIEDEINTIGASLNDIFNGGVGDPRYLQGVQWCISERCRILGLYAPVRQEHTGAGGKPLNTPQVFIMLPDNERGDSSIKAPEGATD